MHDPRSGVRPLAAAQLPPPVADFTGRLAGTTALTGALVTGTVQVVAGRGGNRGRVPDGQLHAGLRGMSEAPADPGEVLGLFLKALGADPVPADPAGRAELYRPLLTGRRVLVLLDAAADERRIRVRAEPRSALGDRPFCAPIITLKTNCRAWLERISRLCHNSWLLPV